MDSLLEDGKGGQISGDRRRLDLGCRAGLEYTDVALQRFIPETHIMLLTNVTPMKLTL